MSTALKPGGYHGIQNVKLAVQMEDGSYSADLIPMLYAKSLSINAVLEAVEVFGDNIPIFRIPKDDGYEGEMGTTAPDTLVERAAGYAIDGTDGLIRTNMTYYLRCALYYEYKETNKFGRDSVVKVWLYSVEIGKGSESYTSDAKSIEFGDYKYPLRVYGDPLMDSTGTNEYLDEFGLGRKAPMTICRPSDAKYKTFGAAVPVPKVKSADPPPESGG